MSAGTLVLLKDILTRGVAVKCRTRCFECRFEVGCQCLDEDFVSSEKAGKDDDVEGGATTAGILERERTLISHRLNMAKYRRREEGWKAYLVLVS